MISLANTLDGVTMTTTIGADTKVPFGKPLSVDVTTSFSTKEEVKDNFDAWAPLEDLGPQHLPGIRKFLGGAQKQTFKQCPRVFSTAFPQQLNTSLFRRSLTEHTAPAGVESSEAYAKSVRYSEVRIKVIQGFLTVTTYSPHSLGVPMNVGSAKGDTAVALYTGTMLGDAITYFPGDTAVIKQAQLMRLNMSHDYIGIRDSDLKDFAEGYLYGEFLDTEGKAYPGPYREQIAKGGPAYPGISREKMFDNGSSMAAALANAREADYVSRNSIYGKPKPPRFNIGVSADVAAAQLLRQAGFKVDLQAMHHPVRACARYT